MLGVRFLVSSMDLGRKKAKKSSLGTIQFPKGTVTIRLVMTRDTVDVSC